MPRSPWGTPRAPICPPIRVYRDTAPVLESLPATEGSDRIGSDSRQNGRVWCCCACCACCASRPTPQQQQRTTSTSTSTTTASPPTPPCPHPDTDDTSTHHPSEPSAGPSSLAHVDTAAPTSSATARIPSQWTTFISPSLQNLQPKERKKEVAPWGTPRHRGRKL